jgi:hypothetical protein
MSNLFIHAGIRRYRRDQKDFSAIRDRKALSHGARPSIRFRTVTVTVEGVVLERDYTTRHERQGDFNGPITVPEGYGLYGRQPRLLHGQRSSYVGLVYGRISESLLGDHSRIDETERGMESDRVVVMRCGKSEHPMVPGAYDEGAPDVVETSNLSMRL